MSYTYQSETARLEQVLLKHASAAFSSQEKIDATWRALHYLEAPDYREACREYDEFVGLLVEAGVEPVFLPADESLSLDAIYCRDAALLTDRGAILCRMGKAARADEPTALGAAWQRLGIPVLGEIRPPGKLEGGDVAWIDAKTLAVGHGYRTNAEGIAQLRELLGPAVEVVEVPLPHYRGPEDVFHLMSILSPIDADLALVYSPLMPVPFRRWLLERGIELVEVPEEEFESMAGNVLAIGPRDCIVLEGNARTRRRLEAAGVHMRDYQGKEISIKGCGGPTCLTRPLRRKLQP